MITSVAQKSFDLFSDAHACASGQLEDSRGFGVGDDSIQGRVFQPRDDVHLGNH